MGAIRFALIGVGKIARDQHLPAIAGNPDFDLVAAVSHHDPELDVPWFATLDALMASGIAVDAVALCTPPQVRHALAVQALHHGLHVFLEKPPGATLAEVETLRAIADARGRTLFASWHSRYAAGVDLAKAWLAERQIRAVRIVWREDVREWHPGQEWIWQAGGLGVFDPGINALSIATHILPQPFHATQAVLYVPANRDAPIAADVAFTDVSGTQMSMNMDWRETGAPTWDITVETDDGTLRLSVAIGHARLVLPHALHEGPDREYAALYARFARLIADGISDVDVAPLRHVADAFLLGQRRLVEPFVE
ncbi:Gfo/Idh/MocA family oxidoreductase [Novosphingobium sp. FSY-8]|uniref:Gfo/Idh/MocA family oxidoreductase n=1 Tax=Novosphingobium ovatum TaxID=1908523 RepID=A0ABW9XEK6_9SPHN|nr:Gfo/Idh/MocA family oxidoreductase [Novosphingobium ovatum]NBC36965.1 Gfo/Idh/MocA family oxidoreductase [Novosphingobium ovatum]